MQVLLEQSECCIVIIYSFSEYKVCLVSCKKCLRKCSLNCNTPDQRERAYAYIVNDSVSNVGQKGGSKILQ